LNFEEIRKKATAEWAALEHSDKPHIIVGSATCGRAAGSETVIAAFKSELAKRNIEGILTEVGCIGLCYAEPLVEIGKPNRPRICYSNVTPEIVPQLVEDYIINDNPHPELAMGTTGEGSIDGIAKFFELPMLKPQVRIALRNCGIIDPDKINHYIARDGYSGFAKALKMSPDEVIEEVKKSGLRGRGGGGFPPALSGDFAANPRAQ